MSRPRAIVFDWDNTLVDSWVCIQESYNMTFRHFGMSEWDMVETQANVAASMRDSFPQMFGERWPEARDVFTKSFESIHLSHLRPLPGAAEMLRAFKDAGIHLSVVSNKRGTFLRKEAEVLGWTDLFAALVGANDAEADKPALAPVLMALDGSGIAPGQSVWFAGDSHIDLQCAVNCGCVPVLVRPEPPRPGEFPSHPPVYYLENCAAMVALVSELAVPISPI
ncbi:HAD hydrolase-like protein [Magnetospirillum aberrantis]|uniref:phosphoglycolate phosphatase n=1 Tax=Magnetospirillum aberrantis SpK TaxID=908842 RepID=A0A7C9UYX0_9PROT|nr:HAD family hydrolase [Magnetospirillum aberrantis SpK]